MKITKKAKREAKQLYRFCLVNDLLDENRARQVAQRILATGKRDRLSIVTHFLQLLKLDCARHTVTIESVTPLLADLQSAVQAGMAHRYGLGLTTKFVQRSELIGGIRIQVGCDVYDGSVRAGLEALKRSFSVR